MQGYKVRTQEEVLKSFSLKSHQGNKCYGGVREEEQGWSDYSSLVGVLYRSLHRDQQGKKGSLFPEAKQIQKGGAFSVRKWGFERVLRRLKF
jgi:hypothetical protein